MRDDDHINDGGDRERYDKGNEIMGRICEKNGKYRRIMDIDNSRRPLARGCKVSCRDAGVDTCVSAAAIKSGMADLIYYKGSKFAYVII